MDPKYPALDTPAKYVAPVPTYPVQPADGYKSNSYPVAVPATPPQTTPESWAIDVDRAPTPTAGPVATSLPPSVAPLAPVAVVPVVTPAPRETLSLSSFRERRRGSAGPKPPSGAPAAAAAANPGWPSPGGNDAALSAYGVAPVGPPAADVKPIGGGIRLSDFASAVAAPQRAAAPAKRDLPPSFLLGEAS